MYRVNIIKLFSLTKYFSCLLGLIILMNFYYIEEGQVLSLMIHFELFSIRSFFLKKSTKLKII